MLSEEAAMNVMGRCGTVDAGCLWQSIPSVRPTEELQWHRCCHSCTSPFGKKGAEAQHGNLWIGGAACWQDGGQAVQLGNAFLSCSHIPAFFPRLTWYQVVAHQVGSDPRFE